MCNMKPAKPRNKTIIAFKADAELSDSLDRTVRQLDTDRSKFIRNAVRKEILLRQVAGK